MFTVHPWSQGYPVDIWQMTGGYPASGLRVPEVLEAVGLWVQENNHEKKKNFLFWIFSWSRVCFLERVLFFSWTSSFFSWTTAFFLIFLLSFFSFQIHADPDPDRAKTCGSGSETLYCVLNSISISLWSVCFTAL